MHWLLLPQEYFQYPGLDMSNTMLNVNYALDVHQQSVTEPLAYHDKWRYSLATHVAKLDTGFKVWTDGVTSFMGGDGRILATWCGTSSFWALAKQLTALGARSTYFGKVGLG